MLDRLLELFRDPGPGRPADPNLDAAVLLVEAARMDETISEAERTRILELVETRLGLDAEAARSLVAEAERITEGAAPWQSYTASLKDRLDYDERVALVEMLWEVVYADGELHDLESSLLRRVAGLLYVSDRDRGAARLRVIERLERGRAPGPWEGR
jgi:uncharacterized tellurite resistance protein B-like protein